MAFSASDQAPFELASKFVNSTNRNIFLTGKAGTGKTTFLKFIVSHTHKNVLVAAPTGIAAINAEGMTLHSLFHLPFGSFLPSDISISEAITNTQISTPRSLKKSLRMNNTKRKLIQEMEVLIIDEVSMLRADILDAVDTVLRYVRRKKSFPFGGVQMVFIGDLLQLPPVIKKEEKPFLDQYYENNYFFEAKALEVNPPIYIELEKVYRQTDHLFIGILNRFRDSAIRQEDLQILNRHYRPSFKPEPSDNYVFLTTHNYKADEINRRALKNINSNPVRFQAKVDGDFSKHLYPVDFTLELKKGAQVMFIKNDYSGQQRYFNGKIGTVSTLSKEQIEVSFNDGTPPTIVEPYTWENKQYTMDKGSNEIKEKIKGTFVHFPIKLAWAITIHKSQGLTFEKAIIDVSQAFAPGQVYVALSRLVALDGLVLNAPLPAKMLQPDEALKQFSGSKNTPETLEEEYHKELPRFICNYVRSAFDFNPLFEEIKRHVSSYYKDEKKSAKQKYNQWARELKNDFEAIETVGSKFQNQLKGINKAEKQEWLYKLQERVQAANSYFTPRLRKCSEKIYAHIDQLDHESGVKKYIQQLKDLDHSFLSQLQSIRKSEDLVKAVMENKEISADTIRSQSPENKKQKLSERKPEKTSLKNKPQKGHTKEVTRQMFEEGNKIEEIAHQRSLTVSTIENHLSHWVGQGAIDVLHFIDPDKLANIIHVAETLDTQKLNEIKSRLGDEYTYSDLRFAMAHYRYSQLASDNG